jgi:hypothetical protein
MALEDIIPLNALFGKSPQYGDDQSSREKKKKKVDREAMASSLMRIPRMDVRVARDLIDIQIKEAYQLQGRAPETLFEEIKKLRPESEEWRLPYIRMAVYFAEHEEHEPNMLHPQAWQ